METTTTEPLPAPAGRRDLYAGIRKALRLFMSRTMCEVGSTDPADRAAVAAALDQVERLMALCEVHLTHEDEFIHPALERARAGATARVAADHVHHAEAIADVRELARHVAESPEANLGAALGRLYRTLALFVADNLHHMHVEETAHNALLWSAYTDAELDAIEGALLAAIPPAVKMGAMQWFLPALNAPERAGMLGGMREGMPPEAFRAVLDIAQRTLAPRDHARLVRDLGPGVAPVAAAA